MSPVISHRSSGSLLRSRIIDAVLFDLAGDGGGVDAQLGARVPQAGGFPQHRFDQALFVVFYGLGQGAAAGNGDGFVALGDVQQAAEHFISHLFGPGGADGQVFDDVFQLADVARPGVLLHDGSLIVGQGEGAAVLFRKEGYKVVAQVVQIVEPLAERRDVDRNHVEAVVQVLAESSL